MGAKQFYEENIIRHLEETGHDARASFFLVMEEYAATKLFGHDGYFLSKNKNPVGAEQLRGRVEIKGEEFFIFEKLENGEA